MIPLPGSVEKIASIASWAFDFGMSVLLASLSANYGSQCAIPARRRPSLTAR